MLVETRELVEEQAIILRKMQRSARLTMAFRVLYWGLIIALSFGAYYLIQPYVDTLKSSLNDLGGISSTSGSSDGTFSQALKNLEEIRHLYSQ